MLQIQAFPLSHKIPNALIASHFTDFNNATDSIRQQRSESITSRSHSDREAESFHETEAFKVDSTAENEFADDEDEDPKEPGKETHNSAGQKVKKTPKTDQQKKRNNNPLLKTSLSIDGNFFFDWF